MLFGIVKVAQIRRKSKSLPPLKVIVMSATMDADKFSQYFRNAPILYVCGRQYPVSVRHVTETTEDWQNGLLSTIFQIHGDAPPKHDILVFMTGQEEIESLAHVIRSVVSSENEGKDCGKVVNFDDDPKDVKLVVVPLYASLQPALQRKVFQPTKAGCRKVILATNIAETSVTIPGVRYVVDSCRVKAK